MRSGPLLPLPDYQRIYQVIYSVLQTSEIAVTHRACIFFAAAGTLILREHYKKEATISAGCMALMVDEKKASVVVYGRNEDGEFKNDENAFHAWVECDGWLIDFMAPIMGISAKEDGIPWTIPPKMLQKPLARRKESLSAIQEQGDFFAAHDGKLTEMLMDSQGVQADDLLKVCLTWFRRPPKKLLPLMLGDSHGEPRKLVVSAPGIVGAW